LEVTYKYGSKYIDTIVAIDSILEMVDGYEITHFEELLYTDHRGYIVDFNLKAYFEIQTFHLDQNEGLMLDSSRKSYREKFIAKVKELIESFGEMTSILNMAR